MGLVPFQALHLASDLPPAVVADLLRGCVGDGPAAPFAGAVADDGFVITRLNEFRGTAMPRMRGSIVGAPGGGTAVRLRLRPPNIVAVFMAIWLGFLSAVAAAIVAAHVHGAGRSLLLLLAPAALAGLSWLLMVSVFKADARWAAEALLASVPALRPAPTGPGGPPR